ncbi:MAG TPA: VWA domain-containing protein [Hanamia sp.]
MIHFQYIEYFLTLAAIPLIIFFYFTLVKWKKKAAKKIGDPALVKELTAQFSPKKFLTKFILVVSAFVLCAFAVAGLVKPDGTQKISRKGTDLMIALDVSKSMLANDVKPSRIERAKQLISKIIDNSPDDKIGLVIFAGRAYLQMPLTIDHEAAKMYLAAASPDDVPTQGTVISDALTMCAAAFNSNDKTFKSVLLISDGEDHDDDAIKTTKEMAKAGIMINTIGIGSPEGAPILNPATGQYLKDDKGETVITKLDEKELSDIAKDGHGIYQLYSNTDEVAANLKKQLANIGVEASISDSSYTAFKQYFQYFLAAAFILLLIEFFFSEKKKFKVKGSIAVFLLMNISLSSFSQSAKSSLIKGNKAYQENKYDAAENEYRDALKKSDQNFIANYNLGNTLYKTNKTDEAIKSYDNAIANTTDSFVKEKAFYNKGVAYQKAKKLPDCISAYKNALVLNPNDEEARQNLQRALEEQKKQDQKQNQKQNPKQDQKKQQQKDQPKNDQQKNNQPQQTPPKMSKQDAIEKLKSLLQNEKELQDKLHKIKGAPAPNSPEKDW